jgi:hypothetical protein
VALSSKHSSSIYQGLAPIVGEEEVEALLSQFPSRDLDEPVTKEFVRAEISDVRTELHTEIAAVRAEIADLRAEFHNSLRQMAIWVAGAVTAGMGFAAAIGAAVG